MYSPGVLTQMDFLSQDCVFASCLKGSSLKKANGDDDGEEEEEEEDEEEDDDANDDADEDGADSNVSHRLLSQGMLSGSNLKA